VASPEPRGDVAATVVEILRVFSDASTRPCLVRTTDGRLHVLKLAGAGPGPRGLLIELLALRFAKLLGAPVPDAKPLLLPHGFPWMVGTDEFDEMIQRSFGWNLGVAFIPNTAPVAAADLGPDDAASLLAIAEADCFLHNVDRPRSNPNLLRGAGGTLHAIDFDACLYFDRALAGRLPASFALPRTHLLAGMMTASKGKALDPDLPISWLAEAPSAWIDAAGREVPVIANALATYIRHWNALCTGGAQEAGDQREASVGESGGCVSHALPLRPSS